jgi:hypothetical protein
MYLAAWRKQREGRVLEPLEAQLAGVIGEHPEYVHYLEAGESAVSSEFPIEEGAQNPFLHMGLHLAVRELVATDRPAGVASIHRALCERYGDAHSAEHAMLQPLAETLWEAQRSGQPPDERLYLQRLERLLGRAVRHD